MGEITIVLPATGFEAQVTQIFESGGINSNKLEYFTKTYNIQKINLAQRDTVVKVLNHTTYNTVKADTTFKPDLTIDKIKAARIDTIVKSDTSRLIKEPRLDFNYHDRLKLVINNNNPAFVDSVKFTPGNVYKYLLAQNNKHLINVKIAETYSYRDVKYSCVLDTGDVYIYDAIGDIVDRQDFKLDSLSHDVKYTLKVGAPVLEQPHQKSLQIVGKVGSRQVSAIIDAVVEGERPRTATFVTKTPDIPLFVLHDPPGDRSFATISKGTTITKNFTTSFEYGGGAGVYFDIKSGAIPKLPVIGKVGGGIHFQARVEAGRDNTSGVTTSTSVTFTEDFSTSSDESLVGADGDIYVGASMNMIYAITDVLKYDAEKSTMTRDTSIAANLDNFNTTFIYTEHHIKNILLKQLNTLYSTAKNTYDIAYKKHQNGDKSYTFQTLNEMNKTWSDYKSNIDAWNTTLNKNKLAKEKAGNVELPPNTTGIIGNNISFSAGAIYDNSITLQKDTTTFSDFSIYLNANGQIGGIVHTGLGNEKEIGALVSTRFNWNGSEDVTNTKTTTTTYHLEDNDLGDFFSVNLKKNREYVTPVFNLISGATSCPHEDNTQYRHLPAIQVLGANEQRMVPADKAAKFEIQIANRSESDEYVRYAIKLDPRTNLDGARVLVGGQDVTNSQASYVIPTGKSFNLPVEVFRGPLASTYEDLSIVIFSACEGLKDNTSGDLNTQPNVKLNAYFQNKCSEIDLFVPGNNWLVNQSNGNKLYVAFSKYDASASSPLTSVALEYRKINESYENSVWSTLVDFPKSELVKKYHDFTFDVSSLPDGKYEIRAKAICKSSDVNYSPVYSGVIDRVSAVAFGLPTPTNGILTNSDVIGVSFNKDIVYTNPTKPVEVTLTRKDNGQIIPATIVGDGRTFIVKTIPENAIANFENMELSATVKNLTDNNGNKVADSVSWSFVVNLSPVYWNPNNIVSNAIENEGTIFKASLINKSALNQQITITKLPSWLTTSTSVGKLVPLGQLNIDFSVDKNLNSGVYTDTVVATIADKQQFLYVTVNVLKTPPTWSVNPNKFKYSMNVTAKFSFDQSENLTSGDTKDKFGIFVGKECRGVAQVEYDRETEKYVAYITAYSNQSSNEQLSIHFWDAFPGIEYQAKESINFIANGAVGNIVNPFVLHPSGVYQTIPIAKGWTWASLNVKNSDMSVKNVLANLTPTEGDVIKSLSDNNAYSQYSTTYGWVGNLKEIDVYNSYMISVAKADTLRILGNFVENAVNVELNKGWNWLGYPMAVNMDISTYLKNFEPANGSQIVSQEEFATYNSTSKTWSGSLKYLRAGKGYKFYSSGDGFTVPVITYQPTNNSALENSIQNTSPLNSANTAVIKLNANSVINSSITNSAVNTANSENSMSVTTVLNVSGIHVNNQTVLPKQSRMPGNNNLDVHVKLSPNKLASVKDNTVKAISNATRFETNVFIDDQLVNAILQTPLADGSMIGFLPINAALAADCKVIEIRVYDREEQRTYSAKLERPIVQKADNIIGTISAPIQLVLEGQADVSVKTSTIKKQYNKGEEFDYTVTIKNNGPDIAVKSFLDDVLPANFDFVSSSPNITYAANERKIKANILQLRNNEEDHYTITLRPTKVGVFNLGNGLVTLNNDVNLTNNAINPITLNIVDNRADANKLLIPQMFTPNGDGINDLFTIVGLTEFFPKNNLTIYNKGYNIVYKKNDYQNDWNGNSLPVGSYGYVLKVVNKEGKEINYTGYVSIVY